MIIAAIILLGLCFGSFINALVWRIHEQSKPTKKRKASDEDLSISKGRSMCVHCGHTLGTSDLLPIISWLSLKGKCRYCKKPISPQYPLVEAFTAVLFLLSYIFWPDALKGWEIAAFGLWLVCLVGFISLIVYDIKWMLLPNRIIFPLYGVAVLLSVVEALSGGSFDPILGAVGGVLVGGGIFYLIFQLSGGRWIGGGDVKLGFLIGAVLGDPLQAGLMLFVASMLGTIFMLPLLITGKMTRNSKIPFGPFLIIAAILVKLVGADLVDMYYDAFIDV